MFRRLDVWPGRLRTPANLAGYPKGPASTSQQGRRPQHLNGLQGPNEHTRRPSIRARGARPVGRIRYAPTRVRSFGPSARPVVRSFGPVGPARWGVFNTPLPRYDHSGHRPARWGVCNTPLPYRQEGLPVPGQTWQASLTPPAFFACTNLPLWSAITIRSYRYIPFNIFFDSTKKRTIFVANFHVRCR